MWSVSRLSVPTVTTGSTAAMVSRSPREGLPWAAGEAALKRLQHDHIVGYEEALVVDNGIGLGAKTRDHATSPKIHHDHAEVGMRRPSR